MVKYAKWSDTYLCMDVNMLYMYVYDLNLYVCICVWSSKCIYEILPGYDYCDLVLRGKGEDEPPSGPVH